MFLLHKLCSFVSHWHCSKHLLNHEWALGCIRSLAKIQRTWFIRCQSTWDFMIIFQSYGLNFHGRVCPQTPSRTLCIVHAQKTVLHAPYQPPILYMYAPPPHTTPSPPTPFFNLWIHPCRVVVLPEQNGRAEESEANWILYILTTEHLLDSHPFPQWALKFLPRTHWNFEIEL